VLTLPPSVRITSRSARWDMRRGHDGLAAIVHGAVGKLDLYGGHLFVFPGAAPTAARSCSGIGGASSSATSASNRGDSRLPRVPTDATSVAIDATELGHAARRNRCRGGEAASQMGADEARGGLAGVEISGSFRLLAGPLQKRDRQDRRGMIKHDRWSRRATTTTVAGRLAPRTSKRSSKRAPPSWRRWGRQEGRHGAADPGAEEREAAGDRSRGPQAAAGRPRSDAGDQTQERRAPRHPPW
jgi:hypothetical protein